jgi:hypothetical protein
MFIPPLENFEEAYSRGAGEARKGKIEKGRWKMEKRRDREVGCVPIWEKL